MSTWRSVLLALTALAVSTSCRADATSDWLRARMAEASTLAAAWGVKDPVVVETDTDYVEVAADGSVYVGRPLIRRLMALPDAEALGRFLLLHELRHVYQREQHRPGTALAQECDADYFAVLQIARAQLARATESDRNDVLAAVLAGQSVALQANALATPGASTTSGAHLSNAQRLSGGAFATWRAINEWLRESGTGKVKAYTEVRLRSQGFVEPAAEDVDTWTSSFCRAVGGEGAGNLRSLAVMPERAEFVTDGPDGVVYMQETLNVRNAGDRPMTYHVWPVLGLQVKDAPTLAGAAIVSGARVDVSVPARGEAHASYRVYFASRTPEDMKTFRWNTSFNTELTALALPAGDRVEPASCARSWRNPADPQMATFYQYLRRAGGVASRQFDGMTGDAKYSFPTAPGLPVYLNWIALPAQVVVADSYIVKLPGQQPTGYLSLAQTTDRAAAQAVFDAHVSAINAICGMAKGVISEGVDKDGDLWLELSRLTMFSGARMRFSARHDKDHPTAPPVYRVTWWVEGKD